MEWNSEIILEFLSLYEKYPVLWDPKDVGYKNRKKLSEAWELIKDELSVDFPIITLKRKKECLMTTYRSLRKKVLDHEKFGEVYKPTWFAYEQMDKFLRGIRGGGCGCGGNGSGGGGGGNGGFSGFGGGNRGRNREILNGKLNNIEDNDGDEQEGEEEDDDDDGDDDYFDPSSLQDIELNNSSMMIETNVQEIQAEQIPFIQNINNEDIRPKSSMKKNHKKRRHYLKYSTLPTSSKSSSSSIDKKITKRIKHASNILQSISKQLYQQQNQPDECVLYGQLLINRLKNLDKNIRTIVMNSIDNLIFRAQMGEIRVIQSQSTIVPSSLPSSLSSTSSTVTTVTTTKTVPATTLPATISSTSTSSASSASTSISSLSSTTTLLTEKQEGTNLSSNNNGILSTISNSDYSSQSLVIDPSLSNSNPLLQSINDPSSLEEQNQSDSSKLSQFSTPSSNVNIIKTRRTTSNQINNMKKS